jgi:hypothetical protein
LEQLKSFFGCGTICKRSKSSNPLGKKDTWEFKLPQSKCKYVYNLLARYGVATRRMGKVQEWMEEFERFFIEDNDGFSLTTWSMQHPGSKSKPRSCT